MIIGQKHDSERTNLLIRAIGSLACSCKEDEIAQRTADADNRRTGNATVVQRQAGTRHSSGGLQR